VRDRLAEGLFPVADTGDAHDIAGADDGARVTVDPVERAE